MSFSLLRLPPWKPMKRKLTSSETLRFFHQTILFLYVESGFTSILRKLLCHSCRKNWRFAAFATSRWERTEVGRRCYGQVGKHFGISHSWRHPLNHLHHSVNKDPHLSSQYKQDAVNHGHVQLVTQIWTSGVRHISVFKEDFCRYTLELTSPRKSSLSLAEAENIPLWRPVCSIRADLLVFTVAYTRQNHTHRGPYTLFSHRCNKLIRSTWNIRVLL